MEGERERGREGGREGGRVGNKDLLVTLVGDSITAAGLFTGEVTGETVLVATETAGRRDTGIFPAHVPVVLPSAIIPTSTSSSSIGGGGIKEREEGV